MEAKQCTGCGRLIPEHKTLSVEIRIPQMYEEGYLEYVTIQAHVCPGCATEKFRRALGLGYGQAHEILWETLDGMDYWSPRQRQGDDDE